jgi:hypothetical protein
MDGETKNRLEEDQTLPMKTSPELSKVLQEASDHVAKWEPWQRNQ